MNTPVGAKPTTTPATPAPKTPVTGAVKKKKFPIAALLGGAALLLLVIGGGVAMYLSQTNQDTRQQAATNCSFWCSGCGGFCGTDGVKAGKTCNQQAAERCGSGTGGGGNTGGGGGGGGGGNTGGGGGGGTGSNFNQAACTNACKAQKGQNADGRKVVGKSDGNVQNCECYCSTGHWNQNYSACVTDGPVYHPECTPGQKGTRQQDGCAYTCDATGLWKKDNPSCGGTGGGTPGGGSGTTPGTTPGSVGSLCNTDADCSSVQASMKCETCPQGFEKEGKKVCTGINTVNGKTVYVNQSIACGGYKNRPNGVCTPGDRKACGDCSGACCGYTNGVCTQYCTSSNGGTNEPTRQAFCNALGQWDCVRTDTCGEVGNRPVGAACIYNSSCLSNKCVDGLCQAGSGTPDADSCKADPRPACYPPAGAGSCNLGGGVYVNNNGFAGCGDKFGKPQDYDCFCKNAQVNCTPDYDKQSCGAPRGSTAPATAAPTTPPTTPPTTSTPGPVCLNITSSKATPTVGDTVTFTCGQVAGAARYEFRVQLPGAVFQDLAPSAAGARTSVPFTVQNAGAHTVQCRICTGTAASTCQQWEPI